MGRSSDQPLRIAVSNRKELRTTTSITPRSAGKCVTGNKLDYGLHARSVAARKLTRCAAASAASILLCACNNNAQQHRSATVSALEMPAFGAPLPRGYATFSSRQTGDLTVESMMGDAQIPWSEPVKRLTIVLADDSKASFMRRFVQSRKEIARATIDDAADGEFYTLANVVPIIYETKSYGNDHPLITFKIGRFHIKCGPPTCMQPVESSPG
jgi:hypothetical protein